MPTNRPDPQRLGGPLTPMTTLPASGDPSPRENPNFPYGVHGVYCESCGRDISAEELASPAHIGHGLREADPDFCPPTGPFDPTYGPGSGEAIAKSGGAYRIKFEADGITPNEE